MTAKLQMVSGRLDAFHRVYLRIVDERARWIGSQSGEWIGRVERPLKAAQFSRGF
jgi:hypothetical protein